MPGLDASAMASRQMKIARYRNLHAGVLYLSPLVDSFLFLYLLPSFFFLLFLPLFIFYFSFRLRFFPSFLPAVFSPFLCISSSSLSLYFPLTSSSYLALSIPFPFLLLFFCLSSSFLVCLYIHSRSCSLLFTLILFLIPYTPSRSFSSSPHPSLPLSPFPFSPRVTSFLTYLFSLSSLLFHLPFPLAIITVLPH